MIDVLSGGRLVSGFLRGGTREYATYGIDLAAGRQMFEESWELIIKAWTEDEPFAWHSAHYDYDVVSILPRPIQQPHPPIVVGANSAESVEWAAKHRAPLLTSLSPTSQIAETFAYYRQYAEEQCSWSPTPQDVGFSRYVYVAATDAKARKECEGHVATVFRPPAGDRDAALLAVPTGRHTERSYAYKTEQHVHVPRYAQIDWDQLERDGYVIVGSPDTVTRKIREQATQLGADIFVPYLPFGSMEPAQGLKGVDLFGREVLPNLH